MRPTQSVVAIQEAQMLADVGHRSGDSDDADFSLYMICQRILENKSGKSNGSCAFVLHIACLTLCAAGHLWTLSAFKEPKMAVE